MASINQRGDTIIEVLLAIGIISVVLSAAYVTVNRATNSARQSQERGVATKLLESQVERLKAKAPDGTLLVGEVNFCLNDASAKIDSTTALPTLETDTFSTAVYPVGCQIDEAGNTYGSSGVQYNIRVVRNGNDFAVYCRWLQAGGRGNEQASISYRVYP